jgi:hypothetical protein
MKEDSAAPCMPMSAAIAGTASSGGRGSESSGIRRLTRRRRVGARPSGARAPLVADSESELPMSAAVQLASVASATRNLNGLKFEFVARIVTVGRGSLGPQAGISSAIKSFIPIILFINWQEIAKNC